MDHNNLRECNGAHILRLVRDGVCRNWSDLYQHFSIVNSEVQRLAQMVSRLFRADLLAYTTEPRAAFELMAAISWPQLSSDADLAADLNRPLCLTKRCYDLRETLGVGLAALALLGRTESQVVRPFFGSPIKLKQPTDVFVVMPFDPAMKPIYDDHIAHWCGNWGSRLRAEMIFSGQGQ
jgi:hypothetical protein